MYTDAYAGINAFGAGADRFTAAVNEKMDQLRIGRYRAEQQANGVRETNGPNKNTAQMDGERYSVEDNADNEYLQAANLTAEELQNGRTVQQFIDQVSGMVNKAVRSKRKLKIGSVSPQHAHVVNDIMRRINPDFSADGYELWIDGTGASHIEDRHGENGKQDKSMASDEAKMLIPWASQNASGGDFLRDSNGNIRRSVRYFNRDQSRAPEIYLEKQIDNDTVYVSECVPDSENKRIWITSAYIKKGSNGQMLNMEETSPQLTPEAPFDGNATNPIVATLEQSVKEESTESEYLTDEQFRERYGLKLRAVDELENGAYSQELGDMRGKTGQQADVSGQKENPAGNRSERYSLDESHGNQTQRGRMSQKWKPNLDSTEWGIVNYIVDHNQGTEITSTCNMFYKMSKGRTVFGVYSTEDSTLLYASRGQTAEKEQAFVGLLREEHKNGNVIDSSTEGLRAWSKTVRMQRATNDNYGAGNVASGRSEGNAELHGRPSGLYASTALRNVLKNIFQEETARRRGDARVSDDEQFRERYGLKLRAEAQLKAAVASLPVKIGNANMLITPPEKVEFFYACKCPQDTCLNLDQSLYDKRRRKIPPPVLIPWSNSRCILPSTNRMHKFPMQWLCPHIGSATVHK